VGESVEAAPSTAKATLGSGPGVPVWVREIFSVGWGVSVNKGLGVNIQTTLAVWVTGSAGAVGGTGVGDCPPITALQAKAAPDKSKIITNKAGIDRNRLVTLAVDYNAAEKEILGEYQVMEKNETLLEEARLLIQRLERISADSIWAHRSSGNRGALLRWVEWLEAEKQPVPGQAVLTEGDLERFKRLIAASFDLLEKAAREY